MKKYLPKIADRMVAEALRMRPVSLFESMESNGELKNRIDHDDMNPPSFLMILTGKELGFTREDGVQVVPVGCLRD